MSDLTGFEPTTLEPTTMDTTMIETTTFELSTSTLPIKSTTEKPGLCVRNGKFIFTISLAYWKFVLSLEVIFC